MATISTIATQDGINWHVEQQGHGPHLLLVPSGEGDCAAFAKVATLLAPTFTVITFDMPGMSRSTAPPTAMANITAAKLADQIVSLMDALSIPSATLWGCSSGALAVLTLATNHPTRVVSAIVHEAPLEKSFGWFRDLSDAEIVTTCRDLFVTKFMGNDADRAAWKDLGPECHARLDKNYVTWVRTYIDQVERTFSIEELTVRPVTWTIGAQSPAGAFFNNVVLATKAGIEIGLLPCQHFPQVTAPAMLAKHVRSAALKYISS